jgi:hypothetical protein
MTAKDFQTITGIGVITVAVIAALTGTGIEVPVWVASVPTLAVTVTLAALRLVVAFKGADNTTIDEAIETAEDAISRLADAAKGAKK